MVKPNMLTQNNIMIDTQNLAGTKIRVLFLKKNGLLYKTCSYIRICFNGVA